MILNLHRQYGIGKQGAAKTTPMISINGQNTIDSNFKLSHKYNKQIHEDWKGAGPIHKVSSLDFLSSKAPHSDAEAPKETRPQTTFVQLSSAQAFQKFIKNRDENGNIIKVTEYTDLEKLIAQQKLNQQRKKQKKSD